MRHEFQFFFPWWMVMTIIYYSRSFWVQKTFSLPLTKPPIYCMGGKYFFSSVCLVIMSLLFYKWNRCRYVTVHYDTMLFGYKLWGYRNVPLYILAKGYALQLAITNIFIHQSLSYETPFFCHYFWGSYYMQK